MKKFEVETESITSTYTIHEVYAESKDDAEYRVYERGEGECIRNYEKGIDWNCIVKEIIDGD